MNHYHSITNNNNNNNTWCWCYSTKQNAFDATVTATLTHNLVFTSSLKQSSCTKHMKFYGQNDRMFVWLEKKKVVSIMSCYLCTTSSSVPISLHYC